MKLLRSLAAITTASLTIHAAVAADRVNVAEDDAGHSAYNAGWNSDQNSGTGFTSWNLQSIGGDAENGHAGHFIAHVEQQPDLDKIAPADRAFGLFANGPGLEAVVGFRGFEMPLEPGDSFSLMFETDQLTRKFDTDDPEPGRVGFSLRSESGVRSWEDYNAGARFEFSFNDESGNYQIIDGNDDPDSGIAMNPAGVAVTVTVVTADTYDLEVTDLETNDTTKFPGRKFAGEPGSPIESFAIFNVDGEQPDAYFNGFQVSRSGESIGR